MTAVRHSEAIRCSIVLGADFLEQVATRAAAIVAEHLAAAPESSPYLTVSEAAERLRAKPQRIYDLLSARRLTRYKDGRRTLVSRTEIDAYVGGERVAPEWPPCPQTGMGSRFAA